MSEISRIIPCWRQVGVVAWELTDLKNGSSAKNPTEEEA
jgi:hypothetical protein